MKKLKYVFYGLGLLLLAANCTKKDPLPDATQQGLNTFGCKIDGVAWIPNGTSGPGGTKPTRASISPSGTFRISANSPQYLLTINIQKLNSNNIGEYNIGNTDNDFGYLGNNDTSFITNKDYLGKVTITKIDTINQIASGTFYFQAKDRKSQNIAEITGGRFDVIYVK